jgi:hypothetical protein
VEPKIIRPAMVAKARAKTRARMMNLMVLIVGLPSRQRRPPES